MRAYKVTILAEKFVITVKYKGQETWTTNLAYFCNNL